MDLGLKGKVAFIAGGSQGLGKAVTMEMCREGAKVAICALDDPELPKAVEEIRAATGAEVIGIPADVSNADQARNFIRKGIEHYGTVDILVNNAGGPPSKTFLEIDDDLWHFGVKLNLMSTVIMTREVVPIMMEKRSGRIINMTSISVKQPIDGLILSNTVRSGVVGLAKTLSNELASYNITVNNVCPGYTMTERVRSLSVVTAQKEGTTPEEVVKRWESSIPMKRLGTPEEFAALVTFLASERAGYITGASIQIDGGWYKGVM
ncbi:SDR family oxidoreductase [Desulforhabdus amnigena]|uniref:Short-chain dehydrogenase n=1 Tax=Desulforhabdus amnigena TaxID=40218 RepID=A0A9W6FSG6_9BACT|nr:SDR family oxidoreductase [Desulforhabdus amnigena]NLJ28385.1 SDR family oxidoreductase [Deltaproteobacteria bacterium]GLI34577.1 short-chain dehydrogenase [Desulforhabdus amnigena]